MAAVARQPSGDKLPAEEVHPPAAEGEGDVGGGLESEGHRRRAVRRTLDGEPKGDALIDAEGEDEADPSDLLPKASAVTMSGLGEAASEGGDEAEGGLLPHLPVGGAGERSESASAAAAGRVLAAALPSMAIAERADAALEVKEAEVATIRLRSPPGNGCTEEAADTEGERPPSNLEMGGAEAGGRAEVVASALLRSGSHHLHKAASSEGEDEWQPGSDDSDGDGILLAAMRGESESFAFCM